MSVDLDLRNRAWTQRRGNITVIGTWIGRDEEYQPCMVLIRTGDEYNPELIPCAIPLEDCWIWSEEIGDGARSFHSARQFAEVLRLDDNPHTIRRIVGIIHDHLGDLVSTPPHRPRGQGEVLAEVTVTHQATGQSHEVVLRDV